MITFRMLLKGYGARIAAGLVAATAMLVIADLTDVAPALAGHAHGLAIGLRLYLAKAPGLALEALPLAVLFGVLITVAGLARSGELLALRGAGAGPLRLALPALVCSAALCGAAVWVSNGPAPRGAREAMRIEARTLGRTTYEWWLLHTQRHWFAGAGRSLYYVEQTANDGRRLTGVVRYDLAKGRFTRVASAEEARWTGGRWRGEGVRVWTLGAKPADVSLSTTTMPIDERPEHFAGALGMPDELTLAELDTAISMRREQGLPTLPLKVERESRETMPLLGLALAVLALGIALGPRTPASAVEAGALGIGVAFAGWTLLALCRALGLAGILGPATAAWLPLLVPGVLGVGLLSLGRMR